MKIWSHYSMRGQVEFKWFQISEKTCKSNNLIVPKEPLVNVTNFNKTGTENDRSENRVIKKVIRISYILVI